MPLEGEADFDLERMGPESSKGYMSSGHMADERRSSRPIKSVFHHNTFLKPMFLAVFGCIVVYRTYKVLFNDVSSLVAASRPQAAMPHGASSMSATSVTVPDYFQTSPELWPGPTATGAAPFLAQTNVVSFDASATYVPNKPLETAMPVTGNSKNKNIFHLMGQLSPYFPNPVGFGVNEYPLPSGANITQVQMISRHGSRYPTSGSNVQAFGQRIANASGNFEAAGALSFLNSWKYQLGAEILVPKGRQELFDSGILHYYNYGQLYNPGSKIIARSTHQDRMAKSAEYFLAGFFGLEWTNNATLELIIEMPGFNNSLAGYMNCNNANLPVSAGGYNATAVWVDIYLQNATERFRGMVKGYDWTIADTFAAQNMCPYETVAYGYSVWCDLFTYEEWLGFSYSADLTFYGTSSFASPTGRAVGIGYVQEVIARLENHTLGYSGSQINTTLDNNTATFPLNQSLYFDFSHDTNIMSIITAFGFKQFAGFLNETLYSGLHNLTVGHLEPFAARLAIELIKTPSPLAANRTYISGNETTYIHFILNQRTLPLGFSFPDCGADRLDGWCELETFLEVQKDATKLADYDYACNGNYEPVPYGTITNGAPLTGH